MGNIEREPDARCGMCQRVGGAYCDNCSPAVFAVHDLWREYEALSTTTRGAVEALREIKRVAAIEAPPVSEEAPAKVWKIAFDALNHLGGQ